MRLTYYMQQRIVKRVIDVVMVLLLIITLFPIFWMVFSSFKSNTEILLGQIPFGKAGNDVVYLESRGRSLYAFTSDGGLNKFDIDSGALLKHDSVKSLATSFIADDHNVWVGTSDKGLTHISLDDFSKKRGFPVSIDGYDINKVVSTSLADDGKYIWMAFQQKDIETILKFDKSKRAFVGEYSFKSALSPSQATSLLRDGGLLWVGTNKGLIALKAESGEVFKTFSLGSLGLPPVDIRDLAKHSGSLFFATARGVFEFSMSTGRIEKTLDSKSGLISDRVNRIIFSGNTLVAATNSGVSAVDIQTGSVRNFEAAFSPVEGSKDMNKLVKADVFGLFEKDGRLLCGASSGRISQIGLGSFAVEKTYTARDGHTVVRWRNYVDLWKNINFGLYLRNSLIICGITMVLAMIFATLAAYALARFNFPGSNFFSIGVLATQMIPAIMYLIPLYIMFTKFTLLTGVPMKGTYFGMIMVYSAFFIPFSIWILRGFFAAIPVELEEAARIDGCSPFQVFWYIVLPLAVPGIIATGIYVFLTAWDELMFAWVLTNADTMTIPVGIRLFVGNYQNRFDLMMAAATVATIPVMVLFFLLQKHIVKGLTAGAVKG
jgi:multiple sugar transport system permease protein